jgi:hypothetical protein
MSPRSFDASSRGNLGNNDSTGNNISIQWALEASHAIPKLVTLILRLLCAMSLEVQ